MIERTSLLDYFGGFDSVQSAIKKTILESSDRGQTRSERLACLVQELSESDNRFVTHEELEWLEFELDVPLDGMFQLADEERRSSFLSHVKEIRERQSGGLVAASGRKLDGAPAARFLFFYGLLAALDEMDTLIRMRSTGTSPAI